jgi:hypothetical protein
MDYVQQKWEHRIQMNEDFPSEREQTPTNIDPPHKGYQRILKKWHYMDH